MGVVGQRVGGELHLRCLAPGRIGAARLHDLRIAGIVGVGGALGEIHLAAIHGEAASALVGVGVESTSHDFGLGPLARVVLLRHEDVARFGARYATQLIPHRLIARRREVELVVIVTIEHGRIVGSP